MSTALWRREGFRSAAAWMASETGTAVGPAIATLEMAGLLGDLPALAAAFRQGLLSEAQAREIADVAADVPDAEEQLVEAAGKLSLQMLREECQRVAAAAIVDEDDRHRRVHRKRCTRAWVRNGVGRFTATVRMRTSRPGSSRPPGRTRRSPGTRWLRGFGHPGSQDRGISLMLYVSMTSPPFRSW